VSAPKEEKRQSGLSLQTLLISSLSAATAAIVVPMFWQRGSVIATAFTPIVVAVASELLRRPADKITAVTPRVARRSATGAAVRAEQPTGVGSRGEGPEQVSKWGTPDDPFGLRQPPPRRKRQFPWKIALITGLVAAVIGGGIVTASELALFGNQIGDSDRRTGLFGGAPRESAGDDEEATPTPTATEGAEGTPTPTPTASAAATPTPTPSATTTPAPSVAPRSAEPTPTPPPTEATPVPTGTP
jgi:hypothetical protein